MTDHTPLMTADPGTDDPSARVQQLIELTGRLDEIFTQENTILRQGRPSGLAPLQGEKARLAAAYAQSIRDAAANRAAMSAAGDRLLQELREITQSFETHAREQRGLLMGAQRAGEGVVAAIASEAAAPTPGYGTPGYSPRGVHGGYAPHQGDTRPSIGARGHRAPVEPIAISEKA